MNTMDMTTAVFLLALSAVPGALAGDCGSSVQLHNNEGEIQSENYPHTFPANSCKLWYIKNQPGSVITISFAHLSLPTEGGYADGSDCTENYVMIGPKPERTICGASTEPYIKRFDSLHDFVWINFKSGPRPSGQGFRLRYIIGPEPAIECPADQFQCDNGKCIFRQWCRNGQNECGDFSDESPLCTKENGFYPATTIPPPLPGCFHRLEGSQGNFSMPPGPLHRAADIVDCAWLIHDPDPSSHITLDFPVFNLKLGEMIKVFDGYSADTRLLGVFMTTAPVGIRSSSNYMLVKFKSSVLARSSGVHFTAVYRGHNSYPTTSTTTTTTANSLNSRCHHVLREPRGSFTMPPDPWFGQSHIQDCSWLIETGEDNVHIVLAFYDVSVPSGATVEVFDGPSSSWPRIFSFGHDGKDEAEAEPLRSSGSTLLIKFHAPTYILGSYFPSERIIFNASYAFSTSPISQSTAAAKTAYPRGCFYHLFRPRGNFSMPPAPMYRTKDIQDCAWLIHITDPSSHILLTFPSLDLRMDERIDLFDGDTESARPLPSPESSSQEIRSSGSSLLVKFTASYFRPRRESWIVFSVVYRTERKSEVCSDHGYSPCGSEDNFACYDRMQRCDGVWDCPLSGADEAGCFGCSPISYSCGNFEDLRKCFFFRDRCNGANVCENHKDEEDCSEDQCTAGRDLYLCSNKRCILKGWQCDGTDDCGDNSDEMGCRPGTSRRVIVAAVIGSLVCSLLLVIAVGCACKVSTLRNRQQQQHRHHRFETPLSRLQAEMFRRRPPPPPYHEAMRTSGPYSEVACDYLLRLQSAQPQEDAERSLRGSAQLLSTAPTSEGDGYETQGDNEQWSGLSHNLIDLSEDVSVNASDRNPVFLAETSSDSNSDNDDDDDSGNLALDESGHMEMEATGSSRRAADSIGAENASEDSGSAMSAEGVEMSNIDIQESDTDKSPTVDPGSSVSVENGDGMGDKKDDDSDVDLLCA